MYETFEIISDYFIDTSVEFAIETAAADVRKYDKNRSKLHGDVLDDTAKRSGWPTLRLLP